jgi:hypothetical protein
MGYYNLPPGNKVAEPLSEFEQVLRSLPLEEAIAALDLLETISRNVIQHPTEDKYRRLRVSNEKLQVLFGLEGTNRIMTSMGWRYEQEYCTLPKEVRLNFQMHIVKILEAKSFYGKQKEVTARANKLSQDPDKAETLKQLEIDRRERAAAAASRQSATPPAVAPAVAAAPARGPPTTAAAPAAAPVAEASATPASSEALAQLIAMGFSEDAARAALVAHDNNPELAMEALLAHGSDEVGIAASDIPSAALNGAATSSAKHAQASAFDFQRREKPEEKRKEATISLQELRAQQKHKYDQFQADPTAKQSSAYQQPPSVSNGGQEAGWFDWMWGGSSSSGNSGGGGNDNKGRPPGPRIKTVGDLPKPVQRGG